MSLSLRMSPYSRVTLILLFYNSFGLTFSIATTEAFPAEEVLIRINYEKNFIESAISPYENSPLSGKHLIIFTLPLAPYLILERNSTGHIVDATGPSADTLKDLARTLNFTFEYYQDKDDVIPEIVDDISSTKIGKIGFFLGTKSDLLVGVLAFTDKRTKVIDFPSPTALNPLTIMIPHPSAKKRNYVAAIWLPFQTQVWIGLIICLVVGSASLYGVTFFVSNIKKDSSKTSNPNVKTKKEMRKIISNDITEFKRLGKAMEYVLGLIVVQGSFSNRALSNNQKITVQLLAGALCLSCFVLVTAYSSVLISFLTAPDSTYTPLVNAVNDLLNKSDVRVTVDRSKYSDIVFMNAVDDPNSPSVFKYIGDQLKRNPEQRCVNQNECIERVRKGSSVYIFNDFLILNAIGEDWKKTGRCDFAVAKEKFLQTLITAFALPKDSPYTYFFNREILRMHAAGLLGRFQTSFTADPFYCLKKIRKEMNNKKINQNVKEPLTLKSLSGAFVVLGIGYALAILVFLFEVCYGRYKIYKIRQQKMIRQRAEEAHRFAIAVAAAVAIVEVQIQSETKPADLLNVISSDDTTEDLVEKVEVIELV